MPSSAALKHLITNPQALVRFQTTGKYPRGERPQGPLVALLQALSPHDRVALRCVTVDARLGYQGSRQFATAEQALRWVCPSPEVFGSYPAKSWQIRSVREVTLDDLLANTVSVPQGIRERYLRLCKPTPVSDAPAMG